MLLQNIPTDIKPKDENKESDNYQQHTEMGAYLLRLNYSKHCRRFVDICADICLHHHERFDGKGFPHGSSGNHNSIYAQICGLLEKFDGLFYGYSKHGTVQFDFVMNQLNEDTGLVSDKLLLLLKECKDDILKYYNDNKI